MDRNIVYLCFLQQDETACQDDHDEEEYLWEEVDFLVEDTKFGASLGTTHRDSSLATNVYNKAIDSSISEDSGGPHCAFKCQFFGHLVVSTLENAIKGVYLARRRTTC